MTGPSGFSHHTAQQLSLIHIIEDKLVDMIAVKAFGSLTDSKIPFERIVKWWSELAAENEVRMYAILSLIHI